MLRIAIVGTGGISQSHIAGYLEFPEKCRIVALVDIYPEKAQEKKERFKLEDRVIHLPVKGKVGYPYFGNLILDCLNRTETAMTQEHAFKAAELCVKAQMSAVRIE